MLTFKGATLLHVAAEFGQVEVARVSLDAGADVNVPALTESDGQRGQSPFFHAATRNGDFGFEVMQLLVSRGANLKLHCRLPSHFERPDEAFECTVLNHARLFPATDDRTFEELKAQPAATAPD